MYVQAASALIVFASISSPFAFARASDVEESFYTRPKADYRTADKLSSDHDNTSMESDIEEADAVAYKGVENDARKEAKVLRREIAKLESKIASTKEGAAQARAKAELAQKKADLLRGDYKWLQYKLKKAQKLEQDAQAAKFVEEKKLAGAQADSDAAIKEIQAAESAAKLAQDERTKIMQRATAVRGVIAAAKQRQQERLEQARRMTEENKKMNTTVSKAEAKFMRVPASSK